MKNTWSAIWMLLPHGFASNGKARLSLVAAPRVRTTTGLLADSQVAQWPSMVRPLDELEVHFENSNRIVLARRVSPEPGDEVWNALFDKDTPVDVDAGGSPQTFESATNSVPVRPAVMALRRFYEHPVGTVGARDAQDDPITQLAAGFAQWDAEPAPAGGKGRAAGMTAELRGELDALLDPAQLTTARVEQAADLLRERGLDAAAAVTPLIPITRRLRAAGVTAADTDAARAPAHPSKLASIRTADRADFHQVIGMSAEHPTLALALGLRMDFEIDPLEDGEHTIRIIGLPLQNAGCAPWSRVSSNRATGRFVMATQPAGPGVATEIRNGMLDMRPENDDKYIITDLDVVGTAAQLQVAARSTLDTSAALPARRNVGFSVVQIDRRAGAVTHALERMKTLDKLFAVGQEDDGDVKALDAPGSQGELVLYADDVTAGYRIDVSTDGGGWLSLMRRVINYQIAGLGKQITVTDEGLVDPMVAVEQRDADGVPRLEIGEELFGFDGWSLVAPKPGPKVTGEKANQPTVETVEPQAAPGYGLTIRVRPEPNTLPRLRYGHRYRFRARAVDLAGNSIDPARCDPALVSPEVRYRHLEPVPSPVMVPRRAFRAGESLTRLVVCSDGDGTVLGGTCERHLAAPKSSQHLAETHGLFDEAMGPDTVVRARARQRLLAIGRIEAGAFTDPKVPNPDNPLQLIDAPGIRVAVNEDATQPPTGTLPPPRGEALPAGEYVILDTDAANSPYLPHPLVTGVALAGLPNPATGGKGDAVVTAKFAGRAWPDVRSSRLILKAGTTGTVTTAVGSAAGRSTVEVTVPPAAELTTRLSCTLDATGVALFDDTLSREQQAAAVAGQQPLFTPAQLVTLVHAVRRPLNPLSIQGVPSVLERKKGATSVEVTGKVTFHAASTDRVDIEAVWQEVIDDGESDVRFEERTATAGSITVPADKATIDWKIRQFLGDTKRRDITYRPKATSAFREYFSRDTKPEDLIRVGTGMKGIVENTARPDLPSLHSIVPTIRWEQTAEADGTVHSIRKAAGFRIYLHRPWCLTGISEELGIVVYRIPNASDSTPIRSLVSRWGSDPTRFSAAQSTYLSEADFPARTHTFELPTSHFGDFGNFFSTLKILGHDVHYDHERDLWYSDVDITIDTDMPFVRLAVVRLQPWSATGCHISSIVLADPVQLLPERRLHVTATAANKVAVKLSGGSLGKVRFEAEWRRRATPPSPGSGDGQTITDIHAFHPADPPTITLGRQMAGWTGTLSTTATGDALKELLAGSIIVREKQLGDSLHFQEEVSRTTYVDVIDRASLGKLT
jgi:hypothetical protein